MQTRHIISLLLFLSLLTTGGTSSASPSTAEKAEQLSPRFPHRAEVERAAFLPPWQSLDSEHGRENRDDDLPLAPRLQRRLAKAAPDETIPVIVRMRQQANLAAVASGVRTTAEKRSRLISVLQATADRSQASVQAYLEGAQAGGLVSSYTSFWVFNGIAVRARPAVVRALAARPDVVAIRLDQWRRWVSVVPVNSNRYDVMRNAQPVEWNISRIRASEVWASLHVSGTDAVVAGMDTGVDWLHPALAARYRGYSHHGPANHTHSWYDATDGGALYPVDGHGHGSHTMGIIVGQDGIGVAPDARWIGVRVLSSQGYGYDSWIHAGFQWLLAPGGDPSKAPDVVNCSWGNKNGHLTTFQGDLRALRAAGILPVFSNGNEGPEKSTVGSPASLPEAFAVGATDEHDEVANFSSRGPSPWDEIRPHVAAPGVHIRSSLPGGVYGEMNGTSMAAPHASGIAALLRSVSPTLSITRTEYFITSTAVPLGDTVPNNDTGWGRVDAFAAVAALAQAGSISGTISDAGSGAPIDEATVTAVSHGGGSTGKDVTDGNGIYRMALSPGFYDVTASAFGHQSETAYGVRVVTGTTAVQDFSLAPLPTGVLRGRVTDADTGQAITATVEVLDTPYETTSDTFSFELPQGAYTVRTRRLGYRVVTAATTVDVGETTVEDLALPPAPSILLVDSGGWYYDSKASYFRRALDDLGYAYDEWPIRHLPDDVPSAPDLRPYDVVVWSAPQDAPGYIGAQDAITGFLSARGRLLLSGQDVGFWDGGGALGYWHPYYRDYLKANFVADNAPTRVLSGTKDDIFAGQTVTIAGPGGADNQGYPDVVDVADPGAAAPVLTYEGDGCGGVRIGTCLDYRSVYLSFGLEGINDRAARREVMGRALNWLTAPPPTVGLDLQPESQLRIGPPGSVVTHPLRVRHVGQGGVEDTVELSLDGVSWDTRLSDASLSLSPCASATIVVSVTIPPTATSDIRDVVTLTAQSSLSPSLALSATLTSKAPAPILLVDDDRWYEQQEKYQAAMEGADLPYDFWQIRAAIGSGPDLSPPAETLQRYPIVVWWTGYDWYRPVTEEEISALREYLDSGGRLFLSSQDFLYYHYDDSFSQDRLGVLSYTEDITPTRAVGVPEDPIGHRLGPWPLVYPRGYQNWSDGLRPAPGTAVSFRDQGRRGIALARRGDSDATAFFAFPFEALPEEERPTVMRQAVGWLSWLGRSSFQADRGSANVGDVLTYTARIKNDGVEGVTASLSNTLPAPLSIHPNSIAGPASRPPSYDTSARRIFWRGSIAPSAAVTIAYQATVTSGSLMYPIANIAHIKLEDHRISFHRDAVVRVGAPDLAPSDLACRPSLVRPKRGVTCTLRLVNAGPADALTATASISLPMEAALMKDTLSGGGDGTIEVTTSTVRWSGSISAGRSINLSYQLKLPHDIAHPPLYSVAFLGDGTGGAWERPAWVVINPYRVYLPMVMRGAGTGKEENR